MTIPTPLRASRLRELLGECPLGRDLRVLGIVDSTSDLVLKRARLGAEDGLVLVAEGQRKGRGRRGAGWASPRRKGLYVSILVREFPFETSRLYLSPALGVATATAIDSTGLTAGIKWPNDVVIAGCKVAGCLIDLVTDQGTPPFAVLGAGINANFDRDDLPAGGLLPAGSLALFLGRPVDRESLLAALLKELACHLDDLRSENTSDIVEEFRARDVLRGAHAAVREGDRIVEGEILAADPVNGLRLRTEEGSEACLRAEHAQILSVHLPGFRSPLRA